MIDFQEACSMQCLNGNNIGANSIEGLREYEIKCGMCNPFKRKLFTWDKGLLKDGKQCKVGSWIEVATDTVIANSHFPAFCAPCPTFQWYKYDVNNRTLGNWTCSFNNKVYTCDLNCIFGDDKIKTITCNTDKDDGEDHKWFDENNDVISITDIDALTCPLPPEQYCNRKQAEEESGAIFNCDGDSEENRPVI